MQILSRKLRMTEDEAQSIIREVRRITQLVSDSAERWETEKSLRFERNAYLLGILVVLTLHLLYDVFW